MTRVRIDLFSSLDGCTSAGGGAENPMGEDWGPLTAAYVATRTMRERVFGDTSGAGTTGIDDAYAAAFFDGVGAEIMGAAMFGLHSHPDDPEWKGWWGDEPPFGCPVYVLTGTAPRPDIEMRGGTTFRFRNAPVEDVLAEATAAAAGLDVRVGGGIGTARAFVRAGLVDDLHVAIAPVVLDRGHRVWEDLRGLEQTHRMTTQVAESGTIHVTFTR
ncbi:dihydrofolate reductase family protein [Nocardioides lianchengensis]|uniref:Dihydrofolate reductase n=1 Tax=Nocardioides lianchengensis TaxID=1045774 RepID=A0A1G6Z4C2_9ACTN|nr:dihydrofolate reductase family protein [Nocardioides lianchengensis]NYG11517.1 dihydrofolate reductase [Nocardioides lianchengensis]SDD97614.1 Dihydrofolate reductase [Nocardioides lianchengensis]